MANFEGKTAVRLKLRVGYSELQRTGLILREGRRVSINVSGQEHHTEIKSAASVQTACGGVRSVRLVLK